jgi:hypothetical protein
MVQKLTTEQIREHVGKARKLAAAATSTQYRQHFDGMAQFWEGMLRSEPEGLEIEAVSAESASPHHEKTASIYVLAAKRRPPRNAGAAATVVGEGPGQGPRLSARA